MFLENQKSDTVEINALLLTSSEKETVLLCKDTLPNVNFFTDKMTATFVSDDGSTAYEGYPFIEQASRVLHSDQFILRLSRD